MTGRYRLMLLLLGLLALFVAPGAVLAQGGTPHDRLDDVSFEQRLGEQVPLELPFVDEAGTAVRLGDYFGHKPVVLTLGYYDCPMLCPLVRDGMAKGLSEVRGLKPGTDYTVVSVSVDPAETPMNAATSKTGLLARYGVPGSADGWHFLTGPQDSIQRLADSVGFKYFYDETIDQYAHAAGILILTPEGRLARYFYGIEYNPSDMRLAMVEASGNKIGSPVDQLLLLCYHFDPTTGKYTGLIMTIVRIAGVITVLGILAMILLLSRGSGRPGAPQVAG